MIIFWINCFCLLAGTGALLFFAVTSWREGEKRALWIAMLLLPANVMFWTLLLVLRQHASLKAANVVILGLLALFALLSLIKYFPPDEAAPDLSRAERFDERDHMFSRNELKFHPDLATGYYKQNPQFRAGDEKIHSRPELGQPGHVYDDPLYSPAFGAAFNYLDQVKGATIGNVNENKAVFDANRLASVIATMARYYGAVDVGITLLQPHHFYSHAGRSQLHWGDAVEAVSGSAIVVVAAMEWRLINQAPTLPVVMESARQYVETAKIASLVAAFIRNLGYRARAHTDGNYQVLCVPLAVEAGLGELGRLGLLIHPVYGPCVRLAVITTELELPATPKRSLHIGTFCRICKKCADNCPTKAITTDEEPASRNFRHWSVIQENCYAFWKQIGTDCAVCIRSCPYTKPDTLLHRLVRFYVSRNPLNQRLALLMDDFFYGRKKKISPLNPGEILPY
ncbi:MAG: 4Fe-4S dicluster domain-containing protein [Candidatus Aminicenantes bacterium]|nr:4Fe-4S dicluster domain-containing protein [Candidatus Aminicenantes bacterium]